MANINTQEKTSTTGWTRINSPIKNNRENSPVVFSTDISWNDIESTLANHQILGEYFTNGKLTSLSIIKILEYIIGQIEQVPEPTPEEQTYYWYVGQTDPLTMTSISPMGNGYENGGGWYELGTTVPETITQLVKGGDSTKYWYTAVPITSGTTLKPVASDMTTLDNSVTAQEIKVFNGVTYQIYWYGGYTAARNRFIFAKK